ncbi:uncharacterized protein LOC108629590 [Ceratina calcarata]|uniref:Uncharacterized protein LOC108629590 n=1 Tax=Ceratina calcarata TaxID=156304 RepID=A0AAJ7J946_9HYME|nr:uncharacterized protein LOC108629590 [Ceratina calcarata]
MFSTWKIKLTVTDKMTPWLMAIFCLATAGCSNLTDQLTSETNYNNNNNNNNNNQQVAILKQIRKINEDGSYTYGYEAGDGSFKVESRDVLGNIKGTFGFVDADGEIKRVSYSSSNGTGFKATTLSPLREHVLRINKTTEKPSTAATALSPSREHILRINRTSTTPIAIVKAETVPTLSTLSSLRDHIFRISNRTTIPIVTERTPIIIASNTNRKPLDLVTRPSSRSSVVQPIPRSNRKTNASTDADDTEDGNTSTTPISTTTSTDQPRTIFNHYLLKNRPRFMINGQQRPLMVIERENVETEPSVGDEEEDSQINRPNTDSNSNRTNHRNYKNYRRIIFNKRPDVKSEEGEKGESVKPKEDVKPSVQEKDEERDDDEKLKVRGNNLRRQLNEDTVNPNKETISVKETINTDETINRRQVIKNPIIENANSETDHSDVYGGSLLTDRPLFTMIPKTSTATTTSTTPRVVQRVSSTVKPKAYLNRESLGSNIKYDDSEVYEPEIRQNEPSPRMRNQQVLPARLPENPGSIQRPVLASRLPEEREYIRNRPIFNSDNQEYARNEPILVPRIPEQRDYVTNGPILIPRVPENQEYVTNRPILIPRIPANPEYDRSRSRIPEGQDLRPLLEDPRFVQNRPILSPREQDFVTNGPVLIRNRPVLIPRIPDDRFIDFREQNYARQNFFGQRPEQFIDDIPRRVVASQEPQDYRSANVERVLLRPLPGQQEANIHYSTENPQDLSSTVDSNLRSKTVNEETTTVYPYKGPVILRPAIVQNSNRLRSKTTVKPGNYETTTEQAYRIIPESSPRPESILNDDRNENYDTNTEYIHRSMIPLPPELPNPIAPPLSRRDFQLLLRRLLISQYGIQALMYPRNYYMENVLNDQQGYSTYQTTESVNYNNQELQPSNVDGYSHRGLQRVRDGANYEQRGYRNFKDNSRERVKYNEEEGLEVATEKINYDYDSRDSKENSNYNFRKNVNYDQRESQQDYQNYGENRQSSNYNDNQEYKVSENDHKKKLQSVRVNDYDSESEVSYSSQNPRMRSKDNMNYNKLSLRYGDRVAIRRPVYSDSSSPHYQDNYDNYEDMYSKRVYRQKLYQKEAVDDDNEILPGPIREALLLRMLQMVINNDRMMPMTSANNYENSYENYYKKRGPVRSVQILGEEEEGSNENERKEEKEMKMKEKMQ